MPQARGRPCPSRGEHAARLCAVVSTVRTCIAVVLLATTWSGAVEGATSAEEHMELGSKSMKAGDFTSALDHYHAACEADPKGYMNFYSRATVFLATGRSRLAAKDLETVLENKPEFDQAATRLADIRLKEGSWARARELYTTMKDTAKLQKIDVAEQQAQRAQELYDARDFAAAIDLATQAIETAPSAEPLRMLRAKSYLETGQVGEAVGDVTRATKLTSGNVEAYFLLSRLHFKTGDRAEALKQIRECVKLDGDHKPAFKFYKKLKKLNKVLDKVDDNIKKNRFGEAVKNIERALELEPEEHYYVNEFKTQTCNAYVKLNRLDKAKEACEDALKYNARNVEVLISRAEIWEQEQEYQKAIDDIREAQEYEADSQRLKDKLARYEKLLKQSLKRDYYKILGLPRNCNKKAINKAYRKLAMEWHPDKFSDEEEKKKAEQKFMDIAAAKEVLTDPQKRQIFDNGEDPLDAEENNQRQRGGFNPFQGGFNPFGGGGGQQHFHFRQG
eukprot:m.181081 g.181081  ORF g.181081 m.181081 type:complete len:504 (+) comp15164_c0_seq1:130-1641(+)